MPGVRVEGGGGEASRPTSMPASLSKSPSLEAGDDAAANDIQEPEVQNTTRRVVEVSIVEEDVGDETKTVDPDMALERYCRKKERGHATSSAQHCPNARKVLLPQDARSDPLFTKQQKQKTPGAEAQSVRIRFGEERLAAEEKSTKNIRAEEVDFKRLREDLEADIEKFSKASKPQDDILAAKGAATAVKGIKAYDLTPMEGGRQFAKGPRPTDSKSQTEPYKFPPASGVRPSPPLPIVDLPVMLSSR